MPCSQPQGCPGTRVLPWHTHTDSSLQDGQGLPGLYCHCQSLAGTSALWVSPCPDPSRGAPWLEGWTQGALCSGAHPSPASRASQGMLLSGNSRNSCRCLCSLGLCPLTHTEDVQGSGMSLHCKHRLLAWSLDVPAGREEQSLCPGVRGHCWEQRWLCKGTAGTAPPEHCPTFAVTAVLLSRALCWEHP